MIGVPRGRLRLGELAAELGPVRHAAFGDDEQFAVGELVWPATVTLHRKPWPTPAALSHTITVCVASRLQFTALKLSAPPAVKELKVRS